MRNPNRFLTFSSVCFQLVFPSWRTSTRFLDQERSSLSAILIFYFIFSSPSIKAQRTEDYCLPNKETSRCVSQVKGLIMKDDREKVRGYVRRFGIGWFFQEIEHRRDYELFSSASFFRKSYLFSLAVSDPAYPGVIPDQNKFLTEVFRAASFQPPNLEIMNLLFNPRDKKKALTWFENGDWPYPFFKKSEEKRYKSLFERFDQIDSIKSNVCQIQDLSQLKKLMAEFPGIEILFKRKEHDLFSCAVESKNFELLDYLFEKNLYHPASFSEKFLAISKRRPNEDSLELLKFLDSKVEKHGLSIPSSLKSKHEWILQHRREELRCLHASFAMGLPEFASFDELFQEVALMSLRNEIESLKKAVQANDRTKIKQVVGTISEIFKQTGMPVNLRDKSGKTLMHYVAGFADAQTIEMLESSLNEPFKMMDYNIQDNEGNTPVHIGIKNKNFDGTLALVDEYASFQNGFGMSPAIDLKLKNKDLNSALDLISEIKVTRDEKEVKKRIISSLKKNQD